MYNRLGVHWATMIPAFLTLVCVPFPFLFYKHGAAIRKKCKYAARAAAVMEMVRRVETGQQHPDSSGNTVELAVTPAAPQQ